MKSSPLGYVLAVLGLAVACKHGAAPGDRRAPAQTSARPAASSAAPQGRASGATSALLPGATPPAAAWPGMPVPGEPPPSLERGRQLYGRMCAVCHGAGGEGYKADAAPALSNPDFLASVNDAFLDFAISIGRARTPMSAWRNDQGGPLSGWDVRSLVAFMRAWPAPKVTLDERYVNGDAAHGKALFAKQCAECHGPHGKAVHILTRQWLTQAKTPFIRYAITKGRPPTPMKGFAESLGDKGIEDVIAYLRGLPSWLVPGEIADRHGRHRSPSVLCR